MAALLLAVPVAPSWAQGDAAGMVALYSQKVDATLTVPADEGRRYARLATDALATAAVSLKGPQYLVVVDRNPYVQALFLFLRTDEEALQLVGASPVSTGRSGGLGNYETPTGVFEHSLANPDFRSTGKADSEGLRGHGVEGMRVFDFGWQKVPKGWGEGGREVTQMRLQMHATDPDLFERRLGTAQSEGTIRIPAALDRLLDLYGVLDADYLAAAGGDVASRVPGAQRTPVAFPGRYLIVVDSKRDDRPDWAPAPYIPRVRRPAPEGR